MSNFPILGGIHPINRGVSAGKKKGDKNNWPADIAGGRRNHFNHGGPMQGDFRLVQGGPEPIRTRRTQKGMAVKYDARYTYAALSR